MFAVMSRRVHMERLYRGGESPEYREKNPKEEMGRGISLKAGSFPPWSLTRGADACNDMSGRVPEFRTALRFFRRT